MTTKQASELWQVSIVQVVTYVNQGRVKAKRVFKPGGSWYWDIPNGTPKPTPKPKSGGRPKKNPG